MAQILPINAYRELESVPYYYPDVPNSNPHHHDHYTYGILFILSLEVLDYFGLLDYLEDEE